MKPDGAYPTYYFPFKLLVNLTASFITGKPRSLKTDAQHAMRGISTPIHIIGAEKIPQCGPGLITINHYTRPGFSIIWAALAIAAQLPETQCWLMTSAWTNRQGGLDFLRSKITHIIFKRIAKIYGLITTPPLPPLASEIKERAISIRKVFRMFKENPQTVLCMAPEGRDSPDGGLGQPAPGTGRFIYHLSQQIEQITPVGVWEERQRLTLHFGRAYNMAGLVSHEDRFVSQCVMDRIAVLLPAPRDNLALGRKT